MTTESSSRESLAEKHAKGSLVEEYNDLKEFIELIQAQQFTEPLPGNFFNGFITLEVDSYKNLATFILRVQINDQKVGVEYTVSIPKLRGRWPEEDFVLEIKQKLVEKLAQVLIEEKLEEPMVFAVARLMG